MKKTFTYLLGGALFALFLVPTSSRATVTATWNFAGNEPDGIQTATNYGSNKEVYITSTQDGVDLYVNTGTSGKFSMNGGTSYIQMVSGTVARVPVVSTNDVVNIDFAGNGGYCTINGSAASLPHTATQAEVTQGYVEIGVEGSGNSMYINSITATLAYLPPVRHATWDFTNSSADATEAVKAASQQADQEITKDGLTLVVKATTSGNIVDNGNSIRTGIGVKFHVPVISIEDVVTVNGYPSYCEYTIGGGGTITATTTNYTATASDVENGYVEVVNGITGTSYLCSIAVKQKAQTSVTIGSTGWATFSNTSATDFTNLAGVVAAYEVTGNTGSAITKNAVTTAAGSTGLMLNAEAGTYAIPLATTGTDLSTTNKLVAVASSTLVGAAPEGYTNFVLVGGSGTASFKKITGTNSATVGAGKAYLQLTGTSFESNLFFLDDDATAINAVKSNTVEKGTFYNLAGQRVENPTKGLYIVNGKKVVIK